MEQENNKDVDLNTYIQDRYQKAINYYWEASKNNKKWYKWTRSLTVIIGALLTLIASLSSSSFIENIDWLKLAFALTTPILAAILTIVAGFSQSFQWGSTWQNMILTAQQLENEYDVFRVTPVEKRNYEEEAEKLNRFVIKESEGFFDRMLGTGKPSTQEVVEEDNGA